MYRGAGGVMTKCADNRKRPSIQLAVVSGWRKGKKKKERRKKDLFVSKYEGRARAFFFECGRGRWVVVVVMMWVGQVCMGVR